MTRGFRTVPTLAALSLAAALSLSAGIAATRTRAAANPASNRPVPQKAAPEKPNIVFLLADDLGRNDVGFMGGRTIKTPNLDKLAASGARLDAFYVQPVCSPTRAALMTGRYPVRYGFQVGVVRPWAQYGLPRDERTLPQALKEAGYETAIVGKWHLGHFQKEYLPTRRGFDHQYGHYNGALDYYTKDRDGGFDWHRNDKVCRDDGYATHLVAKEAVRVIRERDPKKPLFLYVPFNAVHAPLQVPESYKMPYAGMGRQRQTYAGMLAAMDEAIGQILAELETRGLRKNTLIIFSSDNGGPNPGRITDNGPFRAGKGTVYEGGVRVAACAAWEGRIRAGTTVAAPLHMVDWYPTLLKVAGASPTQKLPVDGQDILPTLTEGKPSPHDAILLNAAPNGGAIRMGDWKLVVRTGGGTDADGVPLARTAGAMELYNLKDDPYEKNDLSAKQPEKARELRARYDAFAAQAAPPKNRPRPRGFKAPAVWGEP
jgi:arylsulfatase A-like enzyme